MMRFVVILCTIVSAIVLVLCPFSARFSPKINLKNTIASADESAPVYSFTGSNLLIPYCTFEGNGPLTGGTKYYFDGFFSCTFGSSSGTFSLTEGTNNAFIFDNVDFNSLGVPSETHWTVGSSTAIHALDFLVPGTTRYLRLYVLSGTSFDANIVGVNINSYVVPAGQVIEDYRGASTSTVCLVVIRYFGADSQGNLDTSNFLEFFFVTNNLYNSASRYTNRTYYFTRVDTDSAQYSAGYNSGVSVGYAEGNSAGYSTGYSAGDTAGYSRGYNAGVADSNDYSFIGLIGAVIDAPISAFTGLFNFEILGVNISGFLLGLFTLCVVIVVVRKLLL